MITALILASCISGDLPIQLTWYICHAQVEIFIQVETVQYRNCKETHHYNTLPGDEQSLTYNSLLQLNYLLKMAYLIDGIMSHIYPVNKKINTTTCASQPMYDI